MTNKYFKSTVWDRLDDLDRGLRIITGKVRNDPHALGHRMVARSYVTIRNGEVISGGRNHFVNNGLMGWVNMLNSSGGSPAYYWGFNVTSLFALSLGTDTTTKTTAGTTALTAPIGTGIGTQPNTHTIVPTQDTSAGTATQTITATWNAGSVPADTLGELGLYGGFTTTPTDAPPEPTAPVFASRLSVADGDFTAFTINVSVALTVTWAIQLAFS